MGPREHFLYGCEPILCTDRIEPLDRERKMTERKDDH